MSVELVKRRTSKSGTEGKGSGLSTDGSRRNAEASTDWAYHDEAMVLYNMAVRFRDELIDPLERVDRTRMSDPVISFENERNKEVLATYTIGRNALGLNDQINFNNVHYGTNKHGKKEWMFGRWSQLETLLHEQVHLYLHHLTDIDGKKRPEHGVEFVQKCLDLGLFVTPIHGSHFQVADPDSPFARIMKEMGVKRPKDVPMLDDEKRDWFRPKREKGKSTLNKWSCGCQNARVGTKDFDATCNRCGNVFINASSGTVYKSNS